MGVQLIRKELIGRKVTVLRSRNKKNEGVSGEIIDETMNTVTIKTEDGEKIMAKDQSVFGVSDGGRTVAVDGALLKRRPEDRVKFK